MRLAQLKSTIKGLFLAFGVAGLVSCGSGDDASDNDSSCGGVSESGICLQVDLIAPVHLDGEFTSDVDVNGPLNCNPDPLGTPDPEPLTEHFADVTFSATFVSGNPVAASFVTVTGMRVTFTQNTTDPPATCTAVLPSAVPPNVPPDCNVVPGLGPAIFQLVTPINVTIPVGTSVTQNLPMVNFQRKDDWTPAVGLNQAFVGSAGPFDPSGSPAYLSYNVRYVFTGEDEFGNSVDATGATEITLGSYNNCP